MTPSPSVPFVAGTLQSDPRSGGIKKSSGVNVLPIVKEIWAEVRDNGNTTVDWLIAGYEEGSKTDITVLSKGDGGLSACAESLPDGQVVFGGCKLQCNGRFVSFFHVGEGTSVMARGRACMHKNGVFNTLEGTDGEIEIKKGMTEEDVVLPGGKSSK